MGVRESRAHVACRHSRRRVGLERVVGEGYRIAQPVFDGTVAGQKGSETVTDDFAFRGVLTFGHLCTNKIAFARD